MSNRVTLAKLERDVRWQGDQLRAELRHTPADLRRVISQSITQYREIVTDNGHPYYLAVRNGTITPGRALDQSESGVDFPWGEIDMSGWHPEVVRVYGVDVNDGQEVYSLDQVSFKQRNDFQDYSSGDPPRAFFGFGEYKLGILPVPSGAYQYSVWYLPVANDLVNDNDLFNPGVPNGEQWVVWDCLHRIFVRDNYPSLVQMATMERQKVEMLLVYKMSTHAKANANRRLDTRGVRRMNRLLRSNFWAWRA
jgi:hypothetical protein